jgi:hypothetical protein
MCYSIWRWRLRTCVAYPIGFLKKRSHCREVLLELFLRSVCAWGEVVYAEWFKPPHTVGTQGGCWWDRKFKWHFFIFTTVSELRRFNIHVTLLLLSFNGGSAQSSLAYRQLKRSYQTLTVVPVARTVATTKCLDLLMRRMRTCISCMVFAMEILLL